MRDRKKRNTIIGVLCCLLVFMGIGYAILSQTLTINGIGNVKGNWDVEITSITLKSQTGRATEVSSSYTATTASFEADLYMPGDLIEYEVTVENKGNIDAVLQSITPTTTNKVADIKFSHSEIDNTPLTAGKTITFTMKVEFLESATAIPDVERTEYKLELIYIQYDGVSAYTPIEESSDTSCFTIDEDGTIMSYDYDLCGTDIVIPAKINNIPVKSVNKYGLKKANASIVSDNGEEKIVLDSQEIYDELYNEQYNDMYSEMSDSFTQVIESGEATREELEASISEELGKTTTLEEYIQYIAEEHANSAMSSENFYVRGSDGAPVTSVKMQPVYDENESISWKNGSYLAIHYFDEDGNFEGKDEPFGGKGELTSSYNAAGRGDFLTSPNQYEATKKYAVKIRGSRQTSAYNAYWVYKTTDDNYRTGIKWDQDLSSYIHPQGIMDNPNYGKIVSYTSPKRAYIDKSKRDGYFNIDKYPDFKATSLDMSQAVYIEEIEPASFNGHSSNSEDSKINSLVLPPNVKYIGYGAFEGNSISGELIINSEIREIGASAFDDNQITNIVFSKNSKLDIIEEGAFAANQLTSLNIPASVKEIDSWAFEGNSITQLNIPKNVTFIGVDAFKRNKIATLTFEKDINLQYLDGFDNNLLTSITIPKSVTEISHTAFTNNKITNIIYEDGINLKYISGFEGNQLTSLTIPSTVKTIGYNAFTSNQLTNEGLAKLPSGITRMLKDAFKNNSSLTQITLTSPADIDNWPNGGTVNGATVTYER